ncbi:acetyl-CoA carboxylase biotin carboxyl carrier protein subunit [Vagococcus elongatus]|uniref:Acetyl-CoA carboxylase biotin carboxyl carrier protein subunit n=1 Tax=Vagococcus elongatus TaxID=180344 RepID=A0A430B1W6_9ENTE|nr:acetyl-CoA carboxylase biotin carboxyl carrier protein subunit [Vagococcus elongatus]RSU14316.1 acetyl-CoA carboxylase biotin carboxyl carrier protein subunit [Vagococcus elongatus]
MLRKFKIKIDGKEYLVEMEEIGGVQPQAIPAAPVPTAPVLPVTPAVEEAAPASPPPSSTTSAEDDAMKAPMPGTILRVLVNDGDTVKENQPLMILEAMKMENEIVAEKAGKVIGVHVTQGQIVNAGDALITIR